MSAAYATNPSPDEHDSERKYNESYTRAMRIAEEAIRTAKEVQNLPEDARIARLASTRRFKKKTDRPNDQGKPKKPV